jgi:hypothetical protein
MNIAFSLPRSETAKIQSLEQWLKSGGEKSLTSLLESEKMASWSDVTIRLDNPGSYKQFLVLIRLDTINSILSSEANIYIVMTFDDEEMFFPPQMRELNLMTLTGIINEGLRDWDEKGILSYTVIAPYDNYVSRFDHQLEVVKYIGDILPEAQEELLDNVYSQVFKFNKQMINKYLSGESSYLLPKSSDALVQENTEWNERHLFESGSNQSIASHLRLLIYWSWWCGLGEGWIGEYRSKEAENFEDDIKKQIKQGFDKLEDNEQELKSFLKECFFN